MGGKSLAPCLLKGALMSRKVKLQWEPGGDTESLTTGRRREEEDARGA